MLHGVIERLGLAEHRWFDDAVEKAAWFALSFLVVDVIISKGPLRALLLRLFNQHKGSKEAARRFLSQLAAKIIGMVFLVAVFPLAFQALPDPALASGSRFTARTPTSDKMVEVAAGYFIYDIVICLLRFEDNGPEFLLHAVVCCTVFCTGAAKGIMHWYGAAALMWELSTPFMYLRWLLLKGGFADSPVMPLANAAFMVVFFGCRVVWGPIMSWDFWQECNQQLVRPTAGLGPTAIQVVRLMCTSLNLLNAYWFAQMVRIAVKGGKSKQKAV